MYFARADSDILEPLKAAGFSSDFWKTAKDNDGGDLLVTDRETDNSIIFQQPTRIADSITAFINAWNAGSPDPRFPRLPPYPPEKPIC